MTLAQIVRSYIRDYRPFARAEADQYRRLPSLKEAIRHAALCHRLPGDKRHDHQRRIPGAILKSAETRLQIVNEAIRTAVSFEALHDIIKREIGDIRGIGDLTAYDVANRIGAFR
jgi:hypothetical protein